MTPEKQRIAIAEACGKWHSGWPHEYMNQADRLRHIPNYPFDLNAMHEAESILNADQMVSYDYHLDRMVGNGRQGLNLEYFLWSATASQRAEAFLHTIGKWKEYGVEEVGK